jgi:hypothetical protein
MKKNILIILLIFVSCGRIHNEKYIEKIPFLCYNNEDFFKYLDEYTSKVKRFKCNINVFNIFLINQHAKKIEFYITPYYDFTKILPSSYFFHKDDMFLYYDGLNNLFKVDSAFLKKILEKYRYSSSCEINDIIIGIIDKKVYTKEPSGYELFFEDPRNDSTIDSRLYKNI